MTKHNRLHFRVAGIHYYLPEKTLSNEELADRYEGWSPEKIHEKTGILKRHIAHANEYVSDLATEAAEQLLQKHSLAREKIDGVILCTQTPDVALPSTASLVHHRLGLASNCQSFDFNQGCTGFIYGLAIAGSMIHSGLLNNVLFITADTYSKWCHPLDKSVSTVFGDGAAALLLTRAPEGGQGVGPFIFGTDGRGFANLTVPSSGAHGIGKDLSSLKEVADDSDNIRTEGNLYMNGPELFRFAISAVPRLVKNLLQDAGKTIDGVDKFIFHQANTFMLKNIQKKLKIPDEKMVYELQDVGNTVSATIPIAMQKIIEKGELQPGASLLLIGFGVGYSWGGCFMTWEPDL